MTPTTGLTLEGRRVGITADRRWQEQANLFEKRGASIIHGPTMKTVDLSDDQALHQATVDLVADPPEVTVATTGMGMRMWFEAAEGWGIRDELLAALSATTLLARGAKATSAVRQAGLEVAWRAEHESMDEVIEHLVADPPRGRLAIQLFDVEDRRQVERLRAAVAPTAEVIEVPVYRWLLPDDEGPARALVDAALAGLLDAITFTSQPAVRHLFLLAGDGAGELRDAFNGGGVVAACVGAVCADEARACGLRHPIWPEPPRLPALVRMVESALTAP